MGVSKSCRWASEYSDSMHLISTSGEVLASISYIIRPITRSWMDRTRPDAWVVILLHAYHHFTREIHIPAAKEHFTLLTQTSPGFSGFDLHHVLVRPDTRTNSTWLYWGIDRWLLTASARDCNACTHVTLASSISNDVDTTWFARNFAILASLESYAVFAILYASVADTHQLHSCTICLHCCAVCSFHCYLLSIL